jgi:hypothetical protein
MNIMRERRHASNYSNKKKGLFGPNGISSIDLVNSLLLFISLRLVALGVPGYRSRGLGSILGATRFSEK